MRAQVEAILRNLLARDFVDMRADLVATGAIDSVVFMDLFLRLEKEFDIRIESADLDVDHFRTVERIVAFVRTKRGDRGPEGVP